MPKRKREYPVIEDSKRGFEKKIRTKSPTRPYICKIHENNRDICDVYQCDGIKCDPVYNSNYLN